MIKAKQNSFNSVELEEVCSTNDRDNYVNNHNDQYIIECTGQIIADLDSAITYVYEIY